MDKRQSVLKISTIFSQVHFLTRRTKQAVIVRPNDRHIASTEVYQAHLAPRVLPLMLESDFQQQGLFFLKSEISATLIREK
jgi:hypothetical protein